MRIFEENERFGLNTLSDGHPSPTGDFGVFGDHGNCLNTLSDGHPSPTYAEEVFTGWENGLNTLSDGHPSPTLAIFAIGGGRLV